MLSFLNLILYYPKHFKIFEIKTVLTQLNKEKQRRVRSIKHRNQTF